MERSKIQGDMTLIEAIKASQDEYDEEVQGFNMHGREPLSPLEEQAESIIVEQFDAIVASGVLTQIINGALEYSEQVREPLDIMMVAGIAFRAGMRTQRKLDRPSERTTVDYRPSGERPQDRPS